MTDACPDPLKTLLCWFNAATEEYGDMIEFGIIDPTKVTRTALQNAASIAGLMSGGQI